MKVLHVINSLGGGGRERRMSQVVASLSRTGSCEQAIITFVKGESYAVFDELQVNIYEINEGRKSRLKRYKRILESFRPDIVHLWLETPTELIFFSMAKYRYHYKVIAGFVADANRLSGLNSYTFGVRCAFRLADRIVSNSSAGLKAKKAPLKKSVIIYNGFDFNRFPDTVNKNEKRKKLGIGEDPLVVMSASLKPTKDWMSFINTAKVLQDLGTNVIFAVVGGGEMLEELRNYAENEGVNNVVFLGYRKDVEEILMVADAFMLYTNNEVHAEGVSNAILEAMAAGLPVIATRGGGTAELIQDGEDGYIIEPKEFNAGAKIIASLMRNRENAFAIGAKAKEKVRSGFSIDEQNAKYVELYRTLLNR